LIGGAGCSTWHQWFLLVVRAACEVEWQPFLRLIVLLQILRVDENQSSLVMFLKFFPVLVFKIKWGNSGG